jgi:hypothetical protein
LAPIWQSTGCVVRALSRQPAVVRRTSEEQRKHDRTPRNVAQRAAPHKAISQLFLTAGLKPG